MPSLFLSHILTSLCVLKSKSLNSVLKNPARVSCLVLLPLSGLPPPLLSRKVPNLLFILCKNYILILRDLDWKGWGGLILIAGVTDKGAVHWVHLRQAGHPKSYPVAGVLDEPFWSANPAQLSSRTGPPAYISWNRVQCPYCVAWRAGTVTQLSGLSWVGFV